MYLSNHREDLQSNEQTRINNTALQCRREANQSVIRQEAGREFKGNVYFSGGSSIQLLLSSETSKTLRTTEQRPTERIEQPKQDVESLTVTTSKHSFEFNTNRANIQQIQEVLVKSLVYSVLSNIK